MAENEKNREQNTEQRKEKADIPKGMYADPIANQGDIAEIKNNKDNQ